MVVGERLAGHDALLGRTAVAAMGYGLYVGLAVGRYLPRGTRRGEFSLERRSLRMGQVRARRGRVAVSLLFFVALEMVPKRVRP